MNKLGTLGSNLLLNALLLWAAPLSALAINQSEFQRSLVGIDDDWLCGERMTMKQ